MQLTRRSQVSGKSHTMEIPVHEEDLRAWMNNPNSLIQDAFPHLSDDEREFILTGITPEEWDELFAEDGIFGEDYDDEGAPF